MSAYDKLIEQLTAQPKVWLVTGVAGFIGSNLLETLLRLNQRVVGLDNYVTGSRRNLDEVCELVGAPKWNNFHHIRGDIRDLDTCRRASTGVDFVLHHAALGSVSHSLEQPDEAHASNVTGFLNVLLAARDQRVKRVVYASSSAVYGDQPGSPNVEEKIGRCLSPYAATKRIDEIYADTFALCYELETVGLRYFNVFGPRQDPAGPYAAVIPKWIAALLNNEPVCINGDGETTRDFCYVANVVQANLLAATVPTKEAINKIYNVGVCSRTSLNDLFELLREQLGRRHPQIARRRPMYREFRVGDVRHSVGDILKARRLLGYRPTHGVGQGLTDALNWYCEHLGRNGAEGTPEIQTAAITHRNGRSNNWVSPATNLSP
jgi:UDP-N-acetylglucosamine 4-epimerase